MSHLNLLKLKTQIEAILNSESDTNRGSVGKI